MLQATLEVLSEALLHPHKLKFAGSPIGSEARDRETKTSPSGHLACGLERCQLDTCNTKKKRQSHVRIQFLAAWARLFLISLCSNDCFLSHCIRTIVSNETDEERTCLLGSGAGRSPIDRVIGLSIERKVILPLDLGEYRFCPLGE